MHYFKRNIGEYHKKAGKLSMLEHGAYTLLIDACYDREIFPSFDEAIDWCWAKSDDELAAVTFVLKKFFKLIDGKYVQNRIREEIEQYHSNALINKEIALKREAKKRESKARTVHGHSTNEHERAPKQEPITINQEPIIKSKDIKPPAATQDKPAKKTKAIKSELDYSVWPQMPDKQVFDDWIKMRKLKKANISQTVLNAFGEEFRKAATFGYSVDDCLKVAITSSWTGFKFEWMQNQNSRGNQNGSANQQRGLDPNDTAWADKLFTNGGSQLVEPSVRPTERDISGVAYVVQNPAGGSGSQASMVTGFDRSGDNQ